MNARMIKIAFAVGSLVAVAGMVAGCAVSVPTNSTSTTAPSTATSPTPDTAAEQSAAQSAAQSASEPPSPDADAQSAAAERSAAVEAERSAAAAAEPEIDRDAVAAAAGRGADDAANGRSWAGPVCNPDTNLHRERASQEPYSDAELAAQCAQAQAEYDAYQSAWQSKHDEMDATKAETARVQQKLGLARLPTSGEMQLVHGCEDGSITDDALCVGLR